MKHETCKVIDSDVNSSDTRKCPLFGSVGPMTTIDASRLDARNKNKEVDLFKLN